MLYNNIMDEYVKQSIDSRKKAMYDTYEIGAGEKKKIDALFAEIEKLGKQCKDVGEFEAEFAKSPLNQQYLDLFTEVATNSTVKSTVMDNPEIKNAKKQTVGKMVAEGMVEGAADNALDRAKRAVLPTRAAVHQEAHDALQKVPVLGDAMDIGQKAGYAAHLGGLFKKKKNNQSK